MNFSEFLAGCAGGTLGISLSYPIDTIKTLRQTGQQIRFNRLYSGYPAPLLGMMAEKSVLFWGYDLIRHQTPYDIGVFGSGLGAGLMTTVIVTPFERIKIRSQTTKHSTWKTLVKTLRHDGATSLYRGWSATLFREAPGYGIYFTTYQSSKAYLSPLFEQMSSDSKRMRITADLSCTAVCGAAAGMSAWAFIYPSDPVKTVAQNDNISTSQAFRKIWSSHGIRGFYMGFSPALIRAGILHAGVFLGYEITKGFLIK